MKINITVLIGILLALLAVGCQSEQQHTAVIEGQFMGDKNNRELHLCKVEHGRKVKVATTQIGDGGYFSLAYSVEKPGLYILNVVGSERQINAQRDHNLKRFYLANGTHINVKVKDGEYELVDSNCNKNKLLSQWNTQVDTVFTYSVGYLYNHSEYTDFFPLLPGFVEQGESFKRTINTGDDAFDELMTLLVDTDLRSASLDMLYTPRSLHPKREDYPEYYDAILNEGTPKSERLLELPHGLKYITTYVTYKLMSSPQKPTKDTYMDMALEAIDNNLLKGYFALNNARRYRAYDKSYLDFMQLVEPYLINDYLKASFKAFEMTIRKFETGSPAFNFAGKDVNGKEYQLSDFKGNLVYVDVWATWCGPCKAQIPALKELEKKFHGQPITFMSISVDKSKDHQKWVDFVKQKELTGVQLIADKAFDSDVAKAYGIKAIPRFMLFDKEGKVVTIDAFRPSEEKTEAWLRSML